MTCGPSSPPILSPHCSTEAPPAWLNSFAHRRHPPSTPGPQNATSAVTPAVTPAISFRNVSKRYPGGYEALTSISFDIAPGELVFITGHSGAG